MSAVLFHSKQLKLTKTFAWLLLVATRLPAFLAFTFAGTVFVSCLASSTVAAVPIENRASGFEAGLTNLISTESRLSEDAVRENVLPVYDVASDDAVAARGAANTVTVGRWMSQAELKAMQTTGRVQESVNAGVTSVSLPANPAAYGAARAGDVFVRFDVPRSAIGAADGTWGKIFGPNSIFGPIKGITEMPPATNIVVVP
jgi:hypothetical protein